MSISIKQILKLVISGVLLFLGILAFLFEIIWIYETPYREYQGIFNYVFFVYTALAGGIVLTSIGIASLYTFKIIPTLIPVKQIIFITTSGIMFFLGIPVLIVPLVGFYQNPDALYYGWGTFTGFAYLMLIFGTILTIIGIIFLYKSKLIRKLVRKILNNN